LRADFSPEGIEAHEAGAARERRRQRQAAVRAQVGVEAGGGDLPGGPGAGKRKGATLADESDVGSSEDEDDEGGGGGGLDVYRRRMRARI